MEAEIKNHNLLKATSKEKLMLKALKFVHNFNKGKECQLDKNNKTNMSLCRCHNRSTKDFIINSCPYYK